MHRALRRRNWRTVAVAAVAALGLLVGLAHSGVADDHMGAAAAMCVAVAAGTAIAVAATPRLGHLVPGPPRPASWSPLSLARDYSLDPDGRARGHPAVLQVFRR